MADSGSTSDPESYKLSDLLNCGWKIFEEVNTTDEPIGSNNVQVKIKRGIAALEDVTRMVAQLEVFSRNELLEEIPTADLRFLLTPALLGGLTMKLTGRQQRPDTLRASRRLYRRFLRSCSDYGVAHFSLPPGSPDPDSSPQPPTTKSTASSSSSDLVSMAVQRQAKIQRYRQNKMTEERLVEIKKAVDSENADEEVVRDFYLLTVKKWINIALEETDSIDQELEILERMDAPTGAPKWKPPPRPSVKPFLLTKDAVQAQVFGAGYPSLPTMTVDDWYEQHLKRGVLPDQGMPKRVAVEESVEDHEGEMKDQQGEKDDEEALGKARNWDEWKDSHRRGYGNRKSMG